MCWPKVSDMITGRQKYVDYYSPVQVCYSGEGEAHSRSIKPDRGVREGFSEEVIS